MGGWFYFDGGSNTTFTVFYFIYKKLSKYFRRHDILKDIKSIQKFGKLFAIWKLLYNLENPSSIFSHNDIPSITFFSNLSQKIKILKLNLKDLEKVKIIFL